MERLTFQTQPRDQIHFNVLQPRVIITSTEAAAVEEEEYLGSPAAPISTGMVDSAGARSGVGVSDWLPAMRIPAGARRLYLVCLQLALGASVWGYNIGILSSILVHQGWKSALGDPRPAQKGIITGIYYAGTLISYLFLSHPLADAKGRRFAARSGTFVVCLGAICMASSMGPAALFIMAIGRFVSGLGVGIISTTVPLYQSELSPAKERGKFVTMNHVGFIAGLATGLWAGFFITFWEGSSGDYWGWRILILLQVIPALGFAGCLRNLPESPRWLVTNGDLEQARAVLHALRQATHTTEAITHELHAINTEVESRKLSKVSPLSLSQPLFRDRQLFARMWRAFLLQFMAQMCGATAMKYYLPTLLKALGLSKKAALMAGAVEMTLKIGMTVVEMWIIDRFGRKACLIGGSMVMGTAMLVNGALPKMFPENTSKIADVTCIVFIFVYAMGYSLGLGPAAWVYSSEIFPTFVRARGLNFAASGGSIGSILVAQIWPVGLANFGSGIYFFFMAVNFICVPVISAFYPETKGIALEDIGSLFGKHTHGQAQSALSLVNGVTEGSESISEVPDRDTAQRVSEHGDEDEPLLG